MQEPHTPNPIDFLLESTSPTNLFLCGDVLEALGLLPDGVVDCVITSPPYWGQRKYDAGGIGGEATFEDYLEALLEVSAEVRRVLSPKGSFWLNVGDTYKNKALLGIPWRLAIAMSDRQGWILRNEVVWHKVKGGLDSSRDRLRTVHEPFFHFVRRRQGYFYDVDAIRAKPREAKVVNGAVVSATGVSGVRYRRQIELTTALDEAEKAQAYDALDAALVDVREGRLSDFRMILRGQQRATHSDATAVSGRARELEEKGFYLLRYHPKGSKPGDVWDIIPEDTQRRQGHFAPFPEDLVRIPILATSPEGGLVMDPFCGTGTVARVASDLGRRCLGIDVSRRYVQLAQDRCGGAVFDVTPR